MVSIPTDATPAMPSASETTIITYNDKEWKAVREGRATILAPYRAGANSKQIEDGTDIQQVFYNPIQQFNRDLTVLAIKAYGSEVIERKQATEVTFSKKRKRHYPETPESRHKKVEKLTTKPEPSVHGAEAGAESTGEPMDISTEEPKVEANEGLEEKSGNTQNSCEGQAGGNPRPPQPTPKFTILDALSASGLRALRYAHEIPFVTSVTANDLTASAVESVKQNVAYNKLEDKVRANRGDARLYMMQVAAEDGAASNQGPKHKSKAFDVVDLDPYGTAATFFDAALGALKDGGLLCITCTDSAVFAGTGYPEKTYALYGGHPAKGVHSHEGGLRLIIHKVGLIAATYGLAIEPLLSLSIDYYTRIFIKVRKSPASVKFLGCKTITLRNCDAGCGAFEIQPRAKAKVAANKKGSGYFYKHVVALNTNKTGPCEHCGSKMHEAGPMYGGPIHSKEFIQKILDDLPSASPEVYGTLPRIEGMLRTALEELLPPPTLDEPGPPEKHLAIVDPVPLFFIPSALAKSLHCQSPNENALRGALYTLGYQVTRSHCKGGSIKTDAPWFVIWHIMREWVRQKAPINEEKIKPNTVAYRLLRLDRKPEDRRDPDEPEVVFDEKLGRQGRMRTDGKKLTRYQENPRVNWGPMNRATGL